MKRLKFYRAGRSAALAYTENILQRLGWEKSAEAASDVTHLLLPVPSFDADGSIKGGLSLEDVLASLSKNTVIVGGNLDHPALKGRKTIDLLQDAGYLAENADITAYCAIQVAMEKLPLTLRDCPTLVVGWGRIGKCLAQLLRQMGAKVTVAARKEADRAMLTALGYGARDSLSPAPTPYRLIFNTVPAMVLPAGTCSDDALKIELASKLGIEGSDVVWARGLPGILAPESSGKLIARTMIRIITGKEVPV